MGDACPTLGHSFKVCRQSDRQVVHSWDELESVRPWYLVMRPAPVGLYDRWNLQSILKGSAHSCT